MPLVEAVGVTINLHEWQRRLFKTFMESVILMDSTLDRENMEGWFDWAALCCRHIVSRPSVQITNWCDCSLRTADRPAIFQKACLQVLGYPFLLFFIPFSILY
jgi:hypothetical protein